MGEEPKIQKKEVDSLYKKSFTTRPNDR